MTTPGVEAALNRIGCLLVPLVVLMTVLTMTVYLAYLYGWGVR